MKTARLSSRIATLLLLAASTLAPAPRARAQETDSAAIKDLLTSGPWKITFSKGWTLIRIFNKDGTFYTPDRPDETGRWKLSGKMIVQTFPDTRYDVFTLPLDATGTAGIAKDTETLKAVRDNSPIPPSPTPAVDMDEDTKFAVTLSLVSAPWKVSGIGWDRVRVFDKNGTFTTTDHGDEHGRWKITKNFITLTFASDNHKDLLFLPLKPKGTAGAAENGEPVTAVQQDAGSGNTAAGTPAPASPPSAPVVVPMDDDQRAATIALLTSGPWKIAGGGWADIRIFDKNGTFTTIAHTDEHGRWRMTNTAVILTFADSHKDTISLPLNPKGTAGTDQHGNPTNATLVNDTPEAPAPTSTPGAPAKPVPSGTPSTYFGTDHAG